MSQQLVKKGANGKYSNVNPKSWTEAIKDKNTGQTLVEILQGFNMYFLSYTGDKESTRCLVPNIIRKKGLWITYVDYDNIVHTEWYAANSIEDTSWRASSNWRIGNNMLVGDISISSNGNWVINGKETSYKAIGERGYTPILRVGSNNKLQVSYDEGYTYSNVSEDNVFTQFKVIDNKLNSSTDLGKTWNPVSDYIASWIRWQATTGDTQANNVGRIQISKDNKTWTNLSNDIINNLHISKYIGADEPLPTIGIAEGTIYAKGPTYSEDDSLNENPIYRLWVYAWKDNNLAWQDNGEFTSITAGVVQETGNSETEVMSQKAVSEKLSELGSKIGNLELEVGEIDNIVLPPKSWTEASDDSKIKGYYAKTISNNGNLVDDSSYAYYTNVYVVAEKSRYKIVGRTYSGKTELAAFYNSDTVFDSSTLISIVPYEVTGNPTDIDQIVTVPNGAKAIAVCQYYNTGALPYDQQLKFYIEVIGNGLLDRVESLESDSERIDDEVNDVKSIVSNLEGVLGGESYNVYDASKQTPETISPHYYVNGVPYSDTSFDDKYNATNLFELQPNTEYTVCLVPSLSYVEKPWGDSPQGIFFYDKDGIYISGTSDSTFTTPSETKYARFNYALVMSISLDLLNARCMIVKGRNVPTKYEPYSKVSLEDKVEGLEKDVAENTKSIEGLNDKFSKLEDFTGGESYNLYDKSKQTSETISPHYYVDGKPYTTTQFDASYNCTAMFELEQETEYTIGLVPPYDYEKPWADASQGIFFYDKDGMYISGTSDNTFITPTGTKYARFNYAIIKYITLETVNARCMIVKGSQLPSEYVPYESSNFIEKLEKLEQKIGELEVGAGVIYYEIKTDEINIFQKNGTNSDVAFVLKRKGGNNLFDFYQVLKYSNDSDILETDINKYSPIITSGTDWHAPFKVVADNNADGDNKNTNGGYNDFFTGGNHQYNNNGSGSTPTAKSISLMFYADGKRVNKGDKGYASNIRMEWSNEVQGQNTTKADGTGRHILQENHVLTYDGSRFFSHVELVALEDIHINLWYGFQALYQNVFNKVRFVDTTNRGVYSLPSSANCGSTNKCKGMYLYGDGISLKMEVDDTFDLGKREFNNISYAAFAEEYGKVYFGIVYTSQFAVKTDEMYVLEGGYEFKLS